MANYVNTYDNDIPNRDSLPCFGHKTFSSVSIDAYLKDEKHHPDYRWCLLSIMIDEAVLKWIKSNIISQWAVDFTNKVVYFETYGDSWAFLEWLEEYELRS